MTRLDDEIRSRLHADAWRSRAAAPASTVLRELQPRLRSARRRRRVAIGAIGIVLIGTPTVALGANLADRSTTMVRPADQSEPDPWIDQSTPQPSGTDDHPATSDPAGPVESEVATLPTVVADSSSSSSAPAPTEPASDDSPEEPIPVGAPAETTPPDAAPATSLDTVAESSTSTSIPPAAPDWTPYRLDSLCGSVDVRFLGTHVELVEVLANSGFAIDVKNDGPEEVEVGLHGGDDECELKARVVAGKLVTTVKGPEAPGDGYDD